MDWTIRSVLEWTASDFRKRGIESARLDAELLLSRALEMDRIRLYLDLERPLSDPERETFRALIARRRTREPIAQILGYRDFYGRRFVVTRDVLTPRPDTETLIDAALGILPKDSAARVLDVGAGSGAIGLTLAAERPGVRVTLVDVSEAALRVTTTNAIALGVEDRVEMQHGDFAQGLEGPPVFDLVVSNPPYIEPDVIETLEPEVRDFEPHVALDGGADGLDIVRALLTRIPLHLCAGGKMLIEVGAGQAPAVHSLVRTNGAWAWCQVHRDLSGIDRVVALQRV